MRKIEAFCGDKRAKTLFAIFPVKAGDEIRWLKKVTILQEYRNRPSIDSRDDGKLKWTNIRFMDDK